MVSIIIPMILILLHMNPVLCTYTKEMIVHININTANPDQIRHRPPWAWDPCGIYEKPMESNTRSLDVNGYQRWADQ